MYSRTLAWKIPWTEEHYSPWGLQDLNTTEHAHVVISNVKVKPLFIKKIWATGCPFFSYLK